LIEGETHVPGNPRPKLAIPTLRRPTASTRFHIDFDWWEKSGLDVKTYLYSRLEIPAGPTSEDMKHEEVDLVDPNTAEVRRVDGFQYLMQVYLNQLPDDFLKTTSLVDAIFLALLANANRPMTSAEIAAKVQRPADIISEHPLWFANIPGYTAAL
jgi:hypothetical protein